MFMGELGEGARPQPDWKRLMRCHYCRRRAGLIRRNCAVCARVVRIVEQAGPTVGLVGLVDIFAAEGLTREQVDRVLDAQVDGEPTLRDRLTSHLTNVLMRGLGMPGRQSPEDVRRVRRSMHADGDAAWRAGDKPPEGSCKPPEASCKPPEAS
jgi:hypothetical protein